MSDRVFAPQWLPASLRCTLRGAVAILALARPHKRNAIDAAMIEGLVAAVASSDPEARQRLDAFFAKRAAKVTHQA